MTTKTEASTPETSATAITPSPKSQKTPITTCQICSLQPSLYRCPRCHIRTCSLTCCQSHKKLNNCNGKRNRAAFCSLNEFTDARLKSDYHFLEDVLNASSGAKRLLKSMGAHHHHQQQLMLQRQKDGVTTVPPPFRSALDDDTTINAKRIKTNAGGGTTGDDDWIGNFHPGWRKLVHQARIRGANLLLMPHGMERRKTNATKYVEKKDAIFWTVEWIFHHDDDSKDNEMRGGEQARATTTIITSHRLSEHAILDDELRKQLTSCDYRKRLKSFVSKPRDDVLLFLKKIPCSNNEARYYSIDGGSSVGRMLKGKTIVEFPTIDVVMRGRDENFPRMIKEMEDCGGDE